MNDYRGQLTTIAAARLFIEAGRAILTIQSRKTDDRFTFRFSRPSNDDPSSNQRRWNAGERCIWVSVLTGADNENDYSFIGTIFPSKSTTEIRPSPKSRVALDTPSGKAVRWMLKAIYENQADRLFTQAELWHEGICARCGRKLTVPESIDTGFGPECSQIAGVTRVKRARKQLELDLTIEESRSPLNGYSVYEWGTYQRGSVLAGQVKKSLKEHFDTLEEAQKKYPDAELGHRSAHNYVNHLPGPDDQVPGGAQPDDV